jgi:hypothetical protein
MGGIWHCCCVFEARRRHRWSIHRLPLEAKVAIAFLVFILAAWLLWGVLFTWTDSLSQPGSTPFKF